ncbi:MarR family transcriptional regulator [Mesorhizobium sp. WSM4935]|uniref:MarR family winged helix-turn-helix transcriptional regulator n=1 Tax=Mesorhizobium sp. WSM4935 TaxID=3038547 RepID=UPI0024154246|nr:MarR family transcriptional regulator [Mesorhizobium sp. WSM4935]MDG4875355.1 MarR family transcriptional regulator [Mesorhizobium sp. WSM4935]
MEDAKTSGPPFVGALLRLCWQNVRAKIREAIRGHGFTDLQEPHFAIFSYPLPDGVRPSELARQLRMSRQATNYLVGQMEALGYLERRVGSGGDRRVIYLTERGRRVAEVLYSCLRELQMQWAQEVGQDRFDVFLEVLRQLGAEQTRSF